MPLQTQLNEACRRLVRPVASLLMHCGMTWREFSEVCKSVFVDVASHDFAPPGQAQANVSRTSILTGVSRKEVRRQRALLEQQLEPLPQKTTDATRLLSGWHQDKEFLDDNGQPLVLPLQGDKGSFIVLMQRYGGDIPPAAMLKSLEQAGAVRRLNGARLQVLTRFYMPKQMDPDWIRLAGDVLNELGATLNHNLTRDTATPSRFQGRATENRIAADALPEFHALLEREGQAFLERIDDWLTAHRAAADNVDVATLRLGVGLYAIEEQTNQDSEGNEP